MLTLLPWPWLAFYAVGTLFLSHVRVEKTQEKQRKTIKTKNNNKKT
jgi:hypothetical protein